MKTFIVALAIGVGVAVWVGENASGRHHNVVAAIALFFGLILAVVLFAGLYARWITR
jgi:protein-S-isoprenylcysteine O-methyltransferase Ste14